MCQNDIPVGPCEQTNTFVQSEEITKAKSGSNWQQNKVALDYDAQYESIRI